MFKRALYLTPAFVLAVSLLALLISPKGDALYFQNRSVTISTALVSATSNHNFQLTYPSTNVVGSVVFQYCDNGALPSIPCNAPAGLNVASATLASQTGNIGFSVDAGNTTANKLVLTRPAAAGIITASSYNFSGITNPSVANQTTYVRMTTYPTTDGTGAFTDNGAVAFSTVAPFSVDAFVPPFLRLCVGITVAPDCSSTSGDSIDLGTLSVNATRFSSSQFSIGTNSVTGYNVYSLGTTMTSGNNTITAINPASNSQVGSNQFGLNLRANALPAVGQEPSGVGSGTPQAGYDTPNIFKFQNGDMIATSTLPTDYNRLTASYLVNVSPAQPVGYYSTTVTYLGVADF